MRVVGLFRELGRGIDQSVQSIHAAAGLLPRDKVVSVTEYLRSGVPVFDVMEASVDPFDNSVRIDGGPSLISDGVWVWRNDLAYFVEKYKVALPDEFLSYVLTKVRVSESASSVTARWQDALTAYDLAERGTSTGK
jgi:hypothetical protein